MSKIKKHIDSARKEIKENKLSFIVFVFLRTIVIAILVRSAFMKHYEAVFYCVLTLIMFILPGFLEKRFKIDLPSTLEAIIFIFIFSAEIMGELNSYYLKVPHFDTLLHTICGFICAAVGFGLVDMLNRGKQKVSLSPLYLCIVSFCFSMTIGVLWEFFEYFADVFAGLDMQKDTIISSINSVKLNPEGANYPVLVDNIESVAVNGRELGLGGYLDIGLYDTMKDLLVNFIGALIFCVIGYFSLTGKSRGKVVQHLVPTPTDKDNRLD